MFHLFHKRRKREKETCIEMVQITKQTIKLHHHSMMNSHGYHIIAINFFSLWNWIGVSILQCRVAIWKLSIRNWSIEDKLIYKINTENMKYVICIFTIQRFFLLKMWILHGYWTDFCWSAQNWKKKWNKIPAMIWKIESVLNLCRITSKKRNTWKKTEILQKTVESCNSYIIVFGKTIHFTKHIEIAYARKMIEHGRFFILISKESLFQLSLVKKVSYSFGVITVVAFIQTHDAQRE